MVFTETRATHYFEFKESCPLSKIEGDRNLLIQVLGNLFSNAVKYSPEGSLVSLALKETHDSWILSVADEGVGIEAENLPFVFEKFYRVDNSLTRETGGTGLGLANVKNIATAHGGRVWAESRFGSGSTFFFELPKKAGEE